MFLENYSDIFKSGKPALNKQWRYWREILFSYVTRLFTWKCGNVPQKEIESRLILFGKVGIISNEGLVFPVRADGFYGQTIYPDEWESFNWTTPDGKQGSEDIGKTAVLIDNNSLRNPTIDIIDHYALILAQADITLINTMVNGRAGKSFTANNEKMAQSIRNYQNKLYNGQMDVIIDPSFIGVEVKDTTDKGLENLKSVFDVQRGIFNNFLEDIGVKSNQQKKERLVIDEVSANDKLLKLNLMDMFIARQKGCEQVNKMFNVSWSVEMNIDYDSDGGVDNVI